MDPIINSNNNANNTKSRHGGAQFVVGAKQSKFIFKTSMLTGFAFLVVLGLGYLFSYLFKTGNIQPQVFVYMIIISLVLSFIISIWYSFSKKKSMWLLLTMYAAFMIFFSFTVSSIFSYFEMNELLFIFGITGGTLLLTGLVGFTISDKTAMSMMKIYGILFGVYMLAFLAYFFIVMFSNIVTVQWYSYLIIGLIGLIILISNCFEFYKLKKINEFINMSEISAKDVTKLTIQTSLTLLMSVIQTLMIVARIFASSRS